MVDAETFAGDWYKEIYDYLMLSHFILLINLKMFPDV